jgi:hypothetical protein
MIIFFLIFFTSLITSFQWIALNSYLPFCFSGSELIRYNGYLSTANSIASFLAPALAGLVFSIMKVGTIIALDGATFLFSACIAFSMRRLDNQREISNRLTLSHFVKDYNEGLSFLKRNASILLVVIQFFVFNFFAGISANLSIPLFLERYSKDEAGYILSAMGLGSIFLGSAQSYKPNLMAKITNLIKPMMLISLVNVGIGLISNWFFIIFLNFFLGILISAVNNKASLILQVQVPAKFRGRVFSTARGLGWLCLPISQLFCALLASADVMNFLSFTSKPLYLSMLLIVINMLCFFVIPIVSSERFWEER